jgi:hypothetical protein
MTLTTVELDSSQTRDFSSGFDRWEGTGYYVPDFVSRIEAELDRLAALAPNWDSEGAPRINPAIIQSARQFIGDLPEDIASFPAVVPSAAGTLQFEWNDGNRSLELEIETPSTIHYLKWQPEKGIEEEDVFDIRDVDRAVALIQWFMRGMTHD